MVPKCNMHTHTTFCDGAHTAKEMVEAAIACGCETLGFSGHSSMGISGTEEWAMSCEAQRSYVDEINRLKQLYEGKIEILLGIEQDYFSFALDPVYDYVLGSVHGVIKDGAYFDVDASPQILKTAINELYGGNSMKMIKHYYSLVADVVNKTDCDIIGHFDLVTKFNEKDPMFDTDSKEYRAIALEALDALIESDRLFELNTGAISRGWKTSPYPQKFLLTRLAEKGANVILTSDSHHKDTILYYFEEAVEYARSCGIKELCVYKNKKIEKIGI